MLYTADNFVPLILERRVVLVDRSSACRIIQAKCHRGIDLIKVRPTLALIPDFRKQIFAAGKIRICVWDQKQGCKNRDVQQMDPGMAGYKNSGVRTK